MTEADVAILDAPEPLSHHVAERLVAEIVAAQAARGSATVVLTGGGMGVRTLAAVADLDTSAVDWSRVDVWWGDERFVPADDDERNDGQARAALLDQLDLDPARVHPVPAADAVGSAEEAAERYAAELAAVSAAAGNRPADGTAVPAFDVLMLGVGPDAHVASLFPELDAVAEQRATVVAVHDAPKPPPHRVTLTLPAINAARQVWLVVAGADKAGAVALAAHGAAAQQVPAAGVRGTERTVWFLDTAAAARLPETGDAESA
ncbi:6-phosphogluconolactonase [Tersicoccus solisilvae]|uniref:6-phosphogluconolactonase n=1 Tax=Tersicoccus solisilvae TaxID=1882339 RepID=A0ABQ1P7Z7_9MICC|nr:6-phosphogluconolactonase [Tersicoccus solisilvae]GGC88545.1 6-phosphogluconolactonase [Tersicoccus solisilvae]